MESTSSTAVIFLYKLVLSLALLSSFASAQPSNGDVRLVNSTGSRKLRQGFLEVYLSANNSWGTVCVNTVTQNLADTVCNQLGYVSAINWSSNESSEDFPVRFPLLRSVTCDQTQLHILRCHYFFNTDAMEDICEDGTVIPYITCSNKNLTSASYEGQLALFYGGWNSQGLLKIYLNEQWGTICSEFFTRLIADVVCRQLGYTNAVYFGKYSSNSLIWLRHVNCSNTNTSCFKNCYSAPTIKNIYCSNADNVYLMCTFNMSSYNPLEASEEDCQLNIKTVPMGIVVILMILFCLIVLIYIIIFITRVGVAAYHKTDRYKLKESERRHHFKDVYRSALDQNSLMIGEQVISGD